MQLATSAGNKPWVCNVYFLADDNHNLYWASLPTRRHSQEIENNPDVACAVVVKNIIGESVIGVQIEGSAEMLKPSDAIRELAQNYASKFKRDQQWVEDFVSGKTEHRLYKLTPSAIYLFDEQHFPGGQRQKVL